MLFGWFLGGLYWLGVIVIGSVVLATGFVGGCCGVWFILGWFWVVVLGLVSLVAGVWVVSVTTGFIVGLVGGFLGFGWLLSLGGRVVGWSWSGLGVDGGWLFGIVGLSLVKNGSIGLVVRSLSLVGLSFLGLVLVTVGCFGLVLVIGCTFRSEHGFRFEQLGKVPVKFFLSISITVFLSG